MHAATASPASGRPQSLRLASDAEAKHNGVRVVLRCRPLLAHELVTRNTVPAMRFPNDRAVDVILSADQEGESLRRYEYSRVCSPSVNQESFFHTSGVKALMDSALEGYNVSCLAYGQTGAGKTFTMMGPSTERAAAHTAAEDGIVPRAITYLFERIRTVPGPPVTVRASMCEIYNENVLDLLNFTGEALSIKWSPEKGFFVAGQVVVTCEGLEDVMAVLAEGERNRAVGSHALNRDSSRSHSVMTLWIERAGTPTQARVASKAIFVDLAGSERLKETKSEGTTAVETRYINKSLHVLGKVISMLAEGSAGGGGASSGGGGMPPPPPGSPARVRQVRSLQRGHSSFEAGAGEGGEGSTLAGARRAASAAAAAGPAPPLLPPYRDSKLTKLLSDALGGNAYSVMIACVSPARSCLDETRNTLSYASHAMAIQSAPVVQHVDHKEAALAELRRQVAELLHENGLLRAHIGVPAEVGGDELPLYLEDRAAAALARDEERALSAEEGPPESYDSHDGRYGEGVEEGSRYAVPPGMLSRTPSWHSRRSGTGGGGSAGRARRDPRMLPRGLLHPAQHEGGGSIDAVGDSSAASLGGHSRAASGGLHRSGTSGGGGTPARSPFPSPPPTTSRAAGAGHHLGSHLLLPPLPRGRGQEALPTAGDAPDASDYLARVAARASRTAAEKRAEELEAENAALKQSRDASAARIASLSVTLDTYRANVAKLQRQLLEAQLRGGGGGVSAPGHPHEGAAVEAAAVLRDANQVLQSQVLALQQREISLIQSVAAGGRAAASGSAAPAAASH